MTYWTQRLAAVVVIAVVGKGVYAAKSTEISPGDATLAERFAELGRRTLQTRTLIEPTWRQCAALLEAANRLNPKEERFARFLAEANVQSKDIDAAIKVYGKIIASNKENRGAQIALIDLYLQRLETAEKRLAYLKGLTGNAKLPDEVRANAALKAAKVLLDRTQKEQAMMLLGQSLRLNPLSYDAAVLRWDQLGETATPLERVSALVAILRINPAQPMYSWALARQLGALGLVEQSLIWYTICGNTMPKLGQTVPVQLVVEYACELYIADLEARTKLVTSNVLEAEPSNTDAWLVRLLLDKDKKIEDASNLQKSSVALVNRLQSARKAAGVATATTRPVNSPGEVVIPALVGDIQAIKADTTRKLESSYVSAVSDILWFQMYFRKQPGDPKLMEFLKALLPPDDIALARAEGWNYIVANKLEEAKVKLAAAAERDPLAKMGLLIIEAKDPKQADTAHSEARKLISEHSTGVMAAMLWGGLKGPGVKLVPAKEADAVNSELRKLPRDWVTILDSPQNFYLTRIDPLQISHDFSEPVIVRVTLQNSSDIDLPIGSDAVLHPDLLFDAEQTGVSPHTFPGVAYDRLNEQVVLKAKKSVSMNVRIDQGQLSQFLMTAPSISVPFRVFVTTNAMTSKDGIAPGPGGVRAQMPRVVERRGILMTTQAARDKVFSRLANGNEAEKIRAMECLAVYALLIRADQKATEDLKALGTEFEGKVFNFTDPSPTVQAWNAFLRTALGSADENKDAIRQMASSKSWTTQLLAMLAAQVLPVDQERAIVEQVNQAASDPTVMKFSQARLEALKIATTRPAATEPIHMTTTQPIARLGPEIPTPPPIQPAPTTRPAAAIEPPAQPGK